MSDHHDSHGISPLNVFPNVSGEAAFDCSRPSEYPPRACFMSLLQSWKVSILYSDEEWCHSLAH